MYSTLYITARRSRSACIGRYIGNWVPDMSTGIRTYVDRKSVDALIEMEKGANVFGNYPGSSSAATRSRPLPGLATLQPPRVPNPASISSLTDGRHRWMWTPRYQLHESGPTSLLSPLARSGDQCACMRSLCKIKDCARS